MQYKNCYKCKLNKPIFEFNNKKSRKDGLDSWCKKCRNEHKRQNYKPTKKPSSTNKKQQMKEWVRNNKEKVYVNQLKHNYGISAEEYYKLKEKQNNKCKICNKEPQDGKRLCVDHCHNTGCVRGLLCGNCNRGLRNFLDSRDLLQEAIKYLCRE
jgi:hypothetical protein